MMLDVLAQRHILVQLDVIQSQLVVVWHTRLGVECIRLELVELVLHTQVMILVAIVGNHMGLMHLGNLVMG